MRSNVLSIYHWWMWRYGQLAQQLIGSEKCPSLMKIFDEAIPAIIKLGLTILFWMFRFLKAI